MDWIDVRDADSGRRGNSRAKLNDEPPDGQKTKGPLWKRPSVDAGSAVCCLNLLLHRVHHVEDRQVHRDHHAANDHAKNHDHERLHQ
jgi:hypothetical protein